MNSHFASCAFRMKTVWHFEVIPVNAVVRAWWNSCKAGLTWIWCTCARHSAVLCNSRPTCVLGKWARHVGRGDPVTATVLAGATSLAFLRLKFRSVGRAAEGPVRVDGFLMPLTIRRTRLESLRSDRMHIIT